MTLKSISRVRAIGGSLVITIPKEIVISQAITEGELIKLELSKVKIDGFGKFKGLASFSDEDRMEDRF